MDEWMDGCMHMCVRRPVHVHMRMSPKGAQSINEAHFPILNRLHVIPSHPQHTYLAIPLTIGDL